MSSPFSTRPLTRSQTMLRSRLYAEPGSDTTLPAHICMRASRVTYPGPEAYDTLWMDTPLDVPRALDPPAQCPPLCIPNIPRLSYNSPPLWSTFRSILPDCRQYRHRPPSRALTRMLHARPYAKRTGDTTFPKHIRVRGSLSNFYCI